MGVGGRLVSQVSLKWKGDVFQLFLFPNLLSNISPELVNSVELLAGRWGTVGSVVLWNINYGGGNIVAKEIIQAVDMEKKSIAYKVIEGDIMAVYNAFKITVDVETMMNGEDNIVTWTIEYEKKSEAIPDPHGLLDVGLAMTKQIERHPILLTN